MAKPEEAKSNAPGPEAAGAPKSNAPGPGEAATSADELRKAIVKPAKESRRAPAPKIDPALAGEYRVKHGTVHMGHGVFVEKGGVVNLGAHDAHHMLAVGTIEKLDADDEG